VLANMSRFWQSFNIVGLQALGEPVCRFASKPAQHFFVSTVVV
jgi:hypothetical protein